MVITGEGAIDASSQMGKGVGEIARICREAKVPCIGLAGTFRDADWLGHSRYFAGVFAMSPRLTTPEFAMRDPAIWLPRLAADVARHWPVP